MTIRRVLAWLTISLVAFVASGCGATNTNAPKAEAPDARTSRKDRRDEAPVLVAPPPAYGNKIVLRD
jgi:hypothetical protein